MTMIPTGTIRFKTALLFAGILSFSQNNSFGEFTIQGVATYRHHDLLSLPSQYNLILESRGDSYRITAKAISGDQYNNEVTAGDGKDNYILRQSWPSFDAKNKNQGYREIGSVISGNFPKSSMTMVQLLWLIYCDASHLQAGTNRINIPLHFTGYAPGDALTQVVTFRKDIPGCIDKIQCFSPGYGVITGERGLEKYDLNAPFNNGYLLWEIRVTAVTNVDEFTLPASFEYSQYYPSGNNVPECTAKGTFDLENISDKVTALKLLPVATLPKVPVADWRFNQTAVLLASGKMGTPVVGYNLHGDNWLQSNNPEMEHKMIALHMFIHGRQLAKPNTPVKFAAYIVFVILALFLCYFIFAEINKQTKKTP